MDCPRGGSVRYSKDGFMKGHQGYQCKACEEFIPPEQHVQNKAETFTVKGYNSRIWAVVFWRRSW